MRPHFPASSRTRGFTLIELLAVVAIIGILSAIAIPGYGKYVVKSNRSAAQAYMMDLAHAEAQYFADSRSYTATVATLNVPVPSAVAGKYTFEISVPETMPPGFTITARPVATSSQNGESTLTLDNSGARTPAGTW